MDQERTAGGKGSQERKITPEGTVHIRNYYGSLKGMLRKYDRYARTDYFRGNTVEEFERWRLQTRGELSRLLGLDRMEPCSLHPSLRGKAALEDGIIRETVMLETEPEVWMPVDILVPPEQGKGEKIPVLLALPGHQGAGRFSVAGYADIPAVKKAIDFYNYDYGLQLARMGYVAVCPDIRGFGERRDEDRQKDDETSFLNSTCYELAHMAEPLGETAAGMLTWDAMRLVDYLYERNEPGWDLSSLGCVGFSGGGMQTLWLAAMDDRIRLAVISGYLYGYRDSLLILNGNCSCNYVPHLWEHYDMGDICSLAAPRPLLVQSCRMDHLNGPRGLQNVKEQLDIVRNAYQLYGAEDRLIHDVREGDHHFWSEPLHAELPGMLEMAKQ